MKTDKKEVLSVNAIEVALLLEGIYQRYGYDFRGYSKASMERRVAFFLAQSECKTVSELQHKVLRNETLFLKILNDFTVQVTEMFRDPSFYLKLKEEVFPILKTYSRVKIWHAGCSTGEEVYSLAILLKEEGLYERTRIYATDINEAAIKKAESGIYPLEVMKAAIKNYQAVKGTSSLTEYCRPDSQFFMIKEELKKNILFSFHNLVTDQVFGEMNLIICRNVFIYFDGNLQSRVIRLFYDSLIRKGFLALGSKESIDFTEGGKNFNYLDKNERICQRKD